MADYPTIRDVARFLEAWAPPSSAQSYDNVGLQVGDSSAEVRSGLIGLDMTPGLLDEALSVGASLIVTHHPLIFRPLREVTTASFTSNLALRLAGSGVALYSIHTNLDAASGGVSFALGRQLGLQDLEFLKLLEPGDADVGLGAVGELPSALTLGDFLALVARRLEMPGLRYAGNPEAQVKRVAVCGGAGSDFVEAALEAGADVYVTADVKYHRFFDVMDNAGSPRMALVDAGHYETEAMTERLLRDELAERFQAVVWRQTETRTSPVRTFIRRS